MNAALALADTAEVFVFVVVIVGTMVQAAEQE